MELLNAELLWPIFGAIVAGAVVGAEREYRSSPAGLRTHILVSLSCCLLMMSAVHQMAWMKDTPTEVLRIDPVRMAHGILTGIGFLCGGVIFREGFTVRGLTTAASLWMTASLGILFGVGFYQLAIFGAASTLLVLAAVTFTEKITVQRQIVHLKVRFRALAAMPVPAFDRLLKDQGLRIITIDQHMEDGVMEYGAVADGYNQARAEALTDFLSRDDHVTGFEIRPQSA